MADYEEQDKYDYTRPDILSSGGLMIENHNLLISYLLTSMSMGDKGI